MTFTLNIAVTEAWPFVKVSFNHGRYERSLREAVRMTNEYAEANGSSALFRDARARAIGEARAKWEQTP